MRCYIERSAIALLSNYNETPLGQRSNGWPELHRDRERVQASGLWNSNHVDEEYDPAFLNRLSESVCRGEERTMIVVIQCAARKRLRWTILTPAEPPRPSGRRDLVTPRCLTLTADYWLPSRDSQAALRPVELPP